MRRYGYDMYQYLIFAHKDLTQEYFVSKSGALDGYAKELFERIYKSLFSEISMISSARMICMNYFKNY